MIVNPGIRRFLGSAIQRLFNSASFYAPLTHTLALERGTGSPTFTRAAAKTVENNDGYLVTLLAGEIGFPGARRVRNLFASTGWTGGTSGTLGSGGVAPTGWAALGGTGSITFADSAVHSGSKSIRFQATAQRPYIQQSIAVAASSVYMLLVTVEAVATANFLSNLLAIATVPAGATSIYLKNGAVVDGPTTTASAGDVIGMRLTVSSTAGTPDWRVGLGSAGSPTGDVTLAGPRLIDVTAETDQTTPREYVSVGVESAPYYHGSMVDGVKCFPTDLSGNPIPSTTLLGYQAEGARTNLCTYSQDLSNAAWTTLFVGTGIAPVVTGNFAAAPDGTMTATRVQLNKGAGATTGDYAVIRGATITGLSNPHTCAISVYAKLNTGSSASVLLGGSQNPTGVITVTDEWQRLDVVGQGTFTSNNVDIYLRGSLGSSDTADLLLWGAQLELGSFASSSIATTTVAVTRNADVEATSTNGNIAAAAGSVYLEYTPTHTPSGTIALWGTYVDADNYTAILHDATNLIFRKRIAGSNYDATIANAFVSGTTYKVAATWGAAGTAIYLDGVAGTPHANTTAAQIAATMQVGADGNSLQQPGAGTTNLRIWQRQLSSPEGVAVTA